LLTVRFRTSGGPATFSGTQSRQLRAIGPKIGIVLLVSLIIGKIIIYIVPSLVAIRRHVERLPRVVTVNLLLGWTVIGWIVAMAMATRPHPPPYPPPFEEYGPARRPGR